MLSQSSDKKDMKLLQEFSARYEPLYADKLLKLYYDKCKKNFRAAYIQYQKIITGATNVELYTHFETYKRRALRIQSIIERL